MIYIFYWCGRSASTLILRPHFFRLLNLFIPTYQSIKFNIALFCPALYLFALLYLHPNCTRINMATITQRNGKWRVQIRMKGVSRSATFERASDAKAWAARIESQIMDGIQGNAPRNTIFADLIRRYLSEVTPSKRGAREESYRIGRALKHLWQRCGLPTCALKTSPIGEINGCRRYPHQRRTRINHFIRRLRTRHERVGTSSRKPCTQNQQAEKKPGKDKTANRAGNCRYLRRPPIPA
ncbi:integrase [Neisseria gonorrhoeae]|uniref:Integrase n=1 Tax=Neisseria gonorrhoeae TaxID=485 RepID=A0A378VZW9_NEIGO|nr:integrase [Neisseria gonorrhoeae]